MSVQRPQKGPGAPVIFLVYLGLGVLYLVGTFARFRGVTVYGLALVAVLLLIGIIGITTHSVGRSKCLRAAHRGPVPIGYTTEGQPIYPIVGYAPDGSPVTADRAVGLRPYDSGTNPLAVTGFVLVLLLGPVGIVFAIPFGHVARMQISYTGERGSGLALAALIISYVYLAALAIASVFFGMRLLI